MSHVMQTYKRQPVAFERGQGAWLWDTQGKRYLDAHAGIAVNGLGHAHPDFVRAVQQQVATLIHTANSFVIPRQEQLADKLAELSGMDEAFFCNSGCEANEAALKLARLYGHGKGIETPAIIVMEHAFHGRTLATLSATGNRKVQAGFEPLVPGFVRVPFDDLAAVRKVAENNKNVVAVLLEIVQGESGIHVAHDEYLHGLRALCDENGWLLMFDEVQSGIGRTGKWFAFQHAGVRPDVMALAKGLGSGVPIGACLAAGKAAGVFKPGNHGSTFGGNPLACTAGLATLDIIEKERLLANASTIGDFIRDGFVTRLQNVAGVREVRGKGLMIGIELDVACNDLVAHAREAGLLINVTHDNIVRLLPPLIMTRDEAQQLLDILTPLITNFLAQQRSAA